MTRNTWIDWCQKQLGDLSRRLLLQGYQPHRIEFLKRTRPDFREQFDKFMDQVYLVMEAMADNPDGFHHFDAFTQAKQELLLFTNTHRNVLLELDLAETA